MVVNVDDIVAEGAVPFEILIILEVAEHPAVLLTLQEYAPVDDAT